MTTYKTGNPIGSTDARDLYDNAQNLDNFANGTAASYTDRLGVSRRSLSGIDSAADNVLNSIGYAVPVAYASGISLTLTSQTVDYNGVIYAPKSSALPFTTSSWGTDSAKLRAVQVTDADLISYTPAGTGAVATTVQDKLLETVTPLDFGAAGDGVTDDTAKIVLALNALQNGQTLDLAGRTYALFVGNNGVSSGDAISLTAVPRLYNKSNITIRNGRLFAANPGAAGSKVRFPSTFTVDGCTNIRFENVRLEARGENYGDVDASSGLGSEARRAFAAQNGGHALVIIRSLNTEVNGSHFERAGSCGVVYSMSSNGTVLNDCYSSAMSLGYAAYAADSWAGGIATSGFERHEMVLNNCRSDDNGASYGSKACITAEDSDVVVRINGGVFKDAYANGAAHQLGVAFAAGAGSKVYVTGAQVDNCAAVGGSDHSTATNLYLECFGVKATNLRTSVHIQALRSYGNSFVKYEGCDFEITGTALWSESELSVPTVVANMKITSGFNCDIINCVSSGAHTFAMNTRACYGGIRVIGGRHTLTDRIFDSYGWGGASAGGGRGYEIGGGAKFVVTSASPSTAKTAATTAINAIRNQDAQSAFTYQYIDFDHTTTVECTGGYQNFLNLATLGSGLQERRILAEKLIGARQDLAAGVSYATRVKVISQDGLSGSNVKVTFTFLDNKWPSGAVVVGDAAYANRSLVSSYAGPTVVGSELQGGFFVNGTSYNLTVGSTYNLISS